MNCPRLYAKFLSQAAPVQISHHPSELIIQGFPYQREHRLDSRSSRPCLSAHCQHHSGKDLESQGAECLQSCL